MRIYHLCVLGCGPVGFAGAMRAAGPQVSRTITSIAHFMDHGKGVNDVLKSVCPHPRITEGIAKCLRLLQGKSIFKPHAFPEYLQIRCWHPKTGMIDEKQIQ